jgi:hypothetical protein
MKTYLGDSVYVDFDGFALTLTTENGIPPPSNTIVLEPEVYNALTLFVATRRRRQAPHDGPTRGQAERDDDGVSE